MSPSEEDDFNWIIDEDTEQAVRNDLIGDDYEKQVQRHFEKRGYKVIRYSTGEIVDLEAEKPGEILFIQVKNWRGRVSLDVRELYDYAKKEQAIHRRCILPGIAYSSGRLSQRTEELVKRYDVKTYPIPYKPSRHIIIHDADASVRKGIKGGLKGLRNFFSKKPKHR